MWKRLWSLWITDRKAGTTFKIFNFSLKFGQCGKEVYKSVEKPGKDLVGNFYVEVFPRFIDPILVPLHLFLVQRHGFNFCPVGC